MLYYLRLLILAILTLLITPFLALLAAVLLLMNLIQQVTVSSRRRAPPKSPPLTGLASIIILNWNGKDLLGQALPSVVEAVRVDGRPHEIMVVDNGSTDGSIDFVHKEFPRIQVLALPENRGFAAGNNAGVQAALHDVVVLLNNDMVVDPGFLRPLLAGFGTATFAVSSQIHLQNPDVRREETGRTSAIFRRGMVDFCHRNIDPAAQLRPSYPVFWAGGGSSAYHRERFLALGGFPEIYSPAYVEDTDLSYRAWKAGWEVLLAPQSVVFHKHRASTARRFSRPELETLIRRNQFVFIWKNIRSWRLLLSHCAWLPWTCFRLARDSGIFIWKSLFQAARRIPSAIIQSHATSYRDEHSDREIFTLFSKPGLYFARRRPRPGDRPRSDIQNNSPEARPRILWVTAYLPHTGRHAGAGRMFQLLSRLSAHYRITLLTFLEGEMENELVAEVAAYCEKVIAIRRIVPWRRQLFAYEPFEEFRTPAMESALAQCLEDQDFDLIQLEYSQMACYADATYQIPTLLTKHEVDFAACARRARVEANWGRKLRWFYNYLQVLDREISLTRRVSATICMTEPDRCELRKFFPAGPVHVVNTGVDLNYFATRTSQETSPGLVFVGAFQHLPNVDAMIHFCREMFPSIRARLPRITLTIVGSSPPPAILSLGDIPGVRITGFVPDIRPFLPADSIFIVPLRLGVGIRGKVLEAWSMGMAVVATTVACAGLRCEDGKNILIADSGDRFADQVVALAENAELRRRLGEEGRRTAEQHYGWDASAEQLHALYQGYIHADRAGKPGPLSALPAAATSLTGNRL